MTEGAQISVERMPAIPSWIRTNGLKDIRPWKAINDGFPLLNYGEEGMSEGIRPAP